MDLLKLDSQICFALYRASRAIIRAYGPLLEPLGVTYLQYLVLLVLWEHGSERVQQIGDHLDLDSATLTPLLKKLESKGLIARTRLKSDERVVMIKLTNAGRQLKQSATDIPIQLACSLDINLESPSELKKLDELRIELHKLSKSLSDRRTE